MAVFLFGSKGATLKATQGSGPRFLYGAGLLLASLLCMAAAQAAPASYWLWRSTLNGQTTCAQASPGQGWTRAAGPYRDLHCRERGSQPFQRW